MNEGKIFYHINISIKIRILTDSILANFIDEANLYKRDLLQIHHRLEITATGGVDISTNEIAAKIEKYGRTAQVINFFNRKLNKKIILAGWSIDNEIRNKTNRTNSAKYLARS